MSAVRDLAGMLRARAKMGEENVVVFAELRKYLSFVHVSMCLHPPLYLVAGFCLPVARASRR